MADKYDAQKKYLQNRKQLRVWVNAEKYEKFRQKAEANEESIYGLINKFIADYCKDPVE